MVFLLVENRRHSELLGLLAGVLRVCGREEVGDCFDEDGLLGLVLHYGDVVKRLVL